MTRRKSVAQPFLLGHQWRNQRLLRIAQVVCIFQVVPTICARVISVQTILISSGSRKPLNHNLMRSLNSFSVRH